MRSIHSPFLARALPLVALAVLSACTQGGIATSTGSNASGTTHIVDVNLTLNQPVSTTFGQSGGMKPPILHVAVGDSIIFMNSDGFAHTASSVGTGTQFPVSGPGLWAETQHATTLSTPQWTSGVMQAGASSQTIIADKAGTYFFGCFFHYGAPMRGVIIAQ
jgi:plastocyanin